MAPPPDGEDRRGRELGRVAARRFRAAKTLAEAGLGAEAIAQARDAMLVRVRSLLPPEEDTSDTNELVRAVYSKLLPADRITIDQTGALSRLGDLVRAFGDRDLPVPERVLRQALEEAEEFVGDW
jgi:hypothetical protein